MCDILVKKIENDFLFSTYKRFTSYSWLIKGHCIHCHKEWRFTPLTSFFWLIRWHWLIYYNSSSDCVVLLLVMCSFSYPYFYSNNLLRNLLQMLHNNVVLKKIFYEDSLFWKESLVSILSLLCKALVLCFLI